MKPLWMFILVVCLVFGIWYFWHRSANNSLINGEVRETGSGQAVKTGAADSGTQTPSSEQTPSTATGQPLQMQIAGQTGADTPSGFPQTQTAIQTAPQSDMVPPADTIDRNPPNGMVFAGTGRYQVYRQGDLTWRLNTQSGHACIIFATDSEWRKARVYQNGCRGKG